MRLWPAKSASQYFKQKDETSFSSKTGVEVTRLLWFRLILSSPDNPKKLELSNNLTFEPYYLNPCPLIPLSYFEGHAFIFYQGAQKQLKANHCCSDYWTPAKDITLGLTLWKKRVIISELSNRKDSAFLEELMIYHHLIIFYSVNNESLNYDFVPLWTMRIWIMEQGTDFIPLHEWPYTVVNYFSP